MSARNELLQMLAEKSFRLGEFKLSSGAASDYYIDCRATTLDAEGARLTGEVFLQAMRAQGWRPQAIGGLTLGADPIVVAVAVLSAQQQQDRGANAGVEEIGEPQVHGFLVRKAEKNYGTGQRIEGFRQESAPVVIVDDVCTTGASTIQALQAAREFGFDVIGVMCLVEREEAGGRTNVEGAAAPAPFVAIFTAKQVHKEHLRLKEEPSLRSA
jgi:orotate phosphoribosyltransferase